ncbi:MAG: Pr6Pr family membrane protein [Janthinobacterium lividum]
MNQEPILKNTFFIGLTTLVAWFAIIAQFIISVPEYLEKGRTVAGSFVQLLSYFTIQSNILVAFSLSAVLLFPKTNAGKFFSKVSTATAIAVYITIVSLVYNLVLRPFWHPKGFYKPVDELLHLIVPILYILYWLFVLPKQGLKWKQLLDWLIFPFVYLIYVIARGAATGFYPYFFVDVKTFGFSQVAINAFVLLLVFAFFSALFIFTGRKLFPKK